MKVQGCKMIDIRHKSPEKRKHKNKYGMCSIVRLALVVFVFSVLLLTTGCSQKKISTQKLKSQLDEFITACLEDGTLEEIEDEWLSFTAAENNSLNLSSLTGENGTIIFGTKTTLPFSFKVEDSYGGITVDILYRFCEKYGYRIEVKDFSDTNAMVMAVSAGKCDLGGASTSVTEERKKMVDFSTPYFQNSGVIIMNQEDISSFSDIHSLDGKKIGSTTGSIYPDVIRQKIKNPIVFEYSSNADLCKALQSKKVDAIVEDLGTMRYALQNYETEVIVGTLTEDDQYAFVLPKNDKAGETFGEKIVTSLKRSIIQENRWKQILMGLGTTFLITILSTLLGTLLGFVLFFGSRENNRIITKCIDGFSWLIRGLPTVVLLLVMYYVVFGSLSISGTIVSIISFSLIFAVTVCGMLTNGVRSVNRGQFEACSALGYTERYGFRRIILPQVIRFCLPSYKTEVVALIKATAIVGYIAVQDLTKTGDIIRSSTYEAFIPLLIIAFFYFILAWLLAKITDLIQLAIKKSDDQERYLKGVESDENDA